MQKSEILRLMQNGCQFRINNQGTTWNTGDKPRQTTTNTDSSQFQPILAVCQRNQYDYSGFGQIVILANSRAILEIAGQFYSLYMYPVCVSDFASILPHCLPAPPCSISIAIRSPCFVAIRQLFSNSNTRHHSLFPLHNQSLFQRGALHPLLFGTGKEILLCA